MKNYATPKYEKYIDWIQTARNKKYDWSQIELGLTASEEDFDKFLETQKATNWWEITKEEWKDIITLQKEAEEETLDIQVKSKASLIANTNINNTVTIPTSNKTSWQLYKKVLEKKGFSQKNINNIEKSTIKILKKLSNDTTKSEPIKGLVIGNVQSGKTANMAALMAMSADWSWNFFIILSGTIENLREQTEKRLFNDLNSTGTLVWHTLEHLSKNSSVGSRSQDLFFHSTSPHRYFTVCLKNSTRLKQLLAWINSDKNKKRQMKVIIIDDEADQASINTGNIFNNEQKTINELITNLVENGRKNSKTEAKVPFMAINYIGYTATPYANVLNDADLKSLYPKDFIATLDVSENYFGPQQIFGIPGTDLNQLDIVRTIDTDNLGQISKIHKSKTKEIPKSLQKSICWFLCGVSCMRKWGYKKPISMLVHTSQKTDFHQNIADSIRLWLQTPKSNKILEKCEKTWNEETTKFTKTIFESYFPNYDFRDKEINDYPSFYEIKNEIQVLLKKITNIELNEDKELSYHNSIHLCIDNCKNNGITNDNTYVRLAYPEENNMPSVAPAFIVIGGATLSRGLTLEGLICTYFLRAVGQADTLMQMGRWFGYRIGYELIPRIWLTDKTNEQFQFLSLLDYNLRNEITSMEEKKQSPSEYGPKITNTPMYNFIKITSKKKMQSAIVAKYDYSGTFIQTFLFDNDSDILSYNLDLIKNFLNTLGQTEFVKENPYAANSLIWKNVPFSKLEPILLSYKYQERQRKFSNIETLVKWIKSITDEKKLNHWNIILAGKKSKNNSPNPSWKLNSGLINKVNRSRKKSDYNSDLIDIGVLTDPKDVLADIDYSKLSNESKSKLNVGKTKDYKELREKNGLEKTPQLIIYVIDKHSKAAAKSEQRRDLQAKEDIVGFCINIPGGKKGSNYATEITINLNKKDAFYTGDIEDNDEN